LNENFSKGLWVLEFLEFFRTFKIEEKNLSKEINYVFIVATHVRYLITGCFVSETVEEVSSEERAFDSKNER